MAIITDMTFEDLLAVPYNKHRDKIGLFTGFVIVPTGELHGSGFGCMKFVLTHHNEIVGAVGGWCDVVYLNGIGGYGRYWQTTILSRLVPVIDWSMEFLPKCGCLRVFSSHKLELEDFICNDFSVYDGGADDGKE